MLVFIDNKTGINQEHIDYEYIINDELGNEVFRQGNIRKRKKVHL
jgi:hypothetical protein